MAYLLGRGDLYIGDRDLATGDILALTKFHTPMFEVEITETNAEHYNSSDAVKAKDLMITSQLDGKANIELDEFSAEVLSMAMGGETTIQTSGPTFTAVLFPNPVVVGKTYAIPKGHVNLSTLTIVDSTGSPVTLSAGTHYTVDLKAGLVTILSLTTITQPLKASGTVANGAEITSIMTKRGTEKFLRFNGINIADGDKPVIVEAYRARIATSKIAVKTDGNDVNKCSFTAELLRDPNALHNSVFGKYGRFTKI